MVLHCFNFLLLFQDTLIIKPPKKSPLFQRTIALWFAMLCGVYLYGTCLKHVGTFTMLKFQNIQLIQKPSLEAQIPTLHYPKPESFSRGECALNPIRFFAIISMQRSGSGWFETLLNSHINVSSNGEIFSVIDRRNNVSNIIQTLERVYNLDWFTSASKNECSAAVGFKWMLNQGLMEHHREIVEYFNHRGISAIFLFRRNLLQRMVSVLANSYDRKAKLLNGTHKSHVHSEQEVSLPSLLSLLYIADSYSSLFSFSTFSSRHLNLLLVSGHLMQAAALSSYKPIINSTSLISDLKEVEMITARALENFNSTRHMVLYYEDLVTNRTKLKDVQEFLGLPLMELTSRQVKIHKGSLCDFVSNWDDVNKTLNGTEYERFLHADY
ncbi:nodulation protein H-like [Gossypium australe]|uniref:Sulfotransferase n=1 Tax=Gossypium australe TaxID=47621 RepID=A0A5B6WDH4_9ROSI|nr:nodulation protein H-like [Gossypium australe]